jgi:hypothetical protein
VSRHTQLTIVWGIALSAIGLVVFATGLGSTDVSLSTRVKLYAAWVAAVTILSLGYR